MPAPCRASTRVRRDGLGRRRHRHVPLPAAPARRGARHPRGQPVRRTGTGARTASPTCPTSTPSTSTCARPSSCRRPRSRRSATSSPSTSRCWTTGREIVSIHLSGGDLRHVRVGRSRRASSSREARRRARRRASTRRAAAAGRAWSCSPRTRRGRARRGDAEAVVAHAREARAALKMWFAVDTLEYLRRGGRIGAAQAWLGSALKIKPILTLEARDHAGRARAHGRARVRADGRLRCAQLPRRRRRRLGRPAHPGARRRPQRLSSAAARSSAPSPCFVSEVGPVIGTHVGPGLIGVGGHPARASLS